MNMRGDTRKHHDACIPVKAWPLRDYPLLCGEGLPLLGGLAHVERSSLRK